MFFKAQNFEFRFPRPTLVMGIVNVTPDSFSDGGRYFDHQAAIAHGLALVKQGADLLDVGGESTRPHASAVSEPEELRRVLPVIRALTSQVQVPISIDTMKPSVAREALRAGASMVNDVAANRALPEMWEIVAEAKAGYVCLHMRGTPADMQSGPEYADVVAEVKSFFLERLHRLNGCGIAPDQVILDPGIGFGKTLEHNLELLANLRELGGFGRPLMLGVSRKSFMGKLLGTGVEARLAAGLACACASVASGAAFIRTHDVQETVQAVRMTEAILGRRK